MATMELIKETITIGQVGPYGVRVGDEWIGVNEPLSPSDFISGKTYDVLYRKGKPSEKSPGGKKYINQIVGEGNSAPAAVKPVTKPSQSANIITEPANKDVRILRQGVYQAALHSPALAGFAATVDEYKALVKNVAEDIIKAIEGK
jgi:hypothetical protein